MLGGSRTLRKRPALRLSRVIRGSRTVGARSYSEAAPLAPKIANARNGPSLSGYPARPEDRVPLNRPPAMRLFCILCGSRTIETRPHSEAVSRVPRVANPLNAPHAEAAPHIPCTANPRNAPPLLGFSACPEGREVSERTPAFRLAHMVRGSCALEVRPRSEATPRYPGVGNRRGALLF